VVDRSYPRLLLVGLTVALVLTLGVVATTSTDAFGAYNAAWDGTSELRQTATATGTEPTVARNVSAYRTAAANQSVAVILSPSEPYRTGEASAVGAFVQAGGTLVVAEDYGPHGNDLLDAIGAEARVSGVPLRDERRAGPSPAFPRASTVGNHSAVAGVDRLMLNHGTTVQPGGATPLAMSSEYSYLDRNRNAQLDDAETLRERPVVTAESLGDGTVIVVSDPSLFLNAMLERADNGAFARNLVAPHGTVLLDVSHTASLPPLVAVRLTLQESALPAFAAGTLSTLLFVVLSRPGLVERVRRWRAPPSPSPTLSADEITTTLRTQHPDWDQERIERVTDSLMNEYRQGERDE